MDHALFGPLRYYPDGGEWTGSATLPRSKTPNNNMEDVWGNTLIGHYAMATRRHMHEFGTTIEQLAG
jgi:acetyl-CoA acetyltransferase